MKLIAHRGYTTKYIKENTMEAFRNAFNNGFLGIECDVRKTKDDVLVICHDPFIDRVSDGSGLVSSYTYRELLQFNFGSKEVPSKIPKLDDVLNSFDGIKVIELKTRVDFDKILPFVNENTYFISFDTSYILELSKKYVGVKFGALNYVLNSKKDYNAKAICLLDAIVDDYIVDKFNHLKVDIFIYGIHGKVKYVSEDIFYIVNDKIGI